MKSKSSDNSQERIRKATEVLHKSWWFAFFLIIAPLIVAIAIFAIFNFASVGLFISLSFSIVGFMFSLLFFYKAYDKYRDNPFFLNKTNNLGARIHVLYLISVVSFITTPIFILISPYDSFIYLPLISYAFLYNIVYYYYHFQPIDYFDLKESEFKHAKSTELMIKQPYNFLVFLNYVIHIFFLSFLAPTNFAWLFALLTNIIFYIITFTSTKTQVKSIRESIKEKKVILKSLTIFKRRLVDTQIGLIFILLIEIPLITISARVISGIPFLSLEVINNLFLVIIFVLFYFKSRFYIGFHFTSKLSIYNNSEREETSNEKTQLGYVKYQKYNSVLSSILIILISLYSFSTRVPLIILIVLPFIYFLLHYEQKAGLCSKKYNKFAGLLNSIAILVAISFGIIPSSIQTILINFLILTIALYFVLQIFVKLKYFAKDEVIIFQNLLAVASFCLVLYIFFPMIIESTTFPSDPPVVILVSNILLHSIFILITLLISNYILGIRYFNVKSPKLFRRIVLVNSLLIELILFVFVNFRFYYLIEFIPFLQVLCISLICFPIVFIAFLYLNNVLHIFPKEYFLKYTYFALWILLSDLFISLLIISLLSAIFILLAFDFLITSVFYYFIIKFGVNLDRVKESRFKKYVKINSYLITIELLYLFYTLFFSVFHSLPLFDNALYSIFSSLASVCVLINLISKRWIFSEDFYIKINVFVLLYSVLIVFYLFLRLTLNTIFVFNLPLLVSTLVFFLPVIYLRKKQIYPTFAISAIKVNSVILSATLTVIPTFIGLDIYNLGLYFDLILLIMTVINFTLYILFIILSVYYYSLKKLECKEKTVNFFLKSRVIVGFCISFTTVFYYPWFLLSGTLYAYVLPLITLLISWFLLFYYSYKREYFNLDLIKKLTIYNFLALSALIISIPTIIGLELVRIGLLPNYILIITITLFLLFCFLRVSEFISTKIKLKSIYIKSFKTVGLITWFSFTLFVSYYIASIFITTIELTPFTYLILSCCFFVFFTLSIYTISFASKVITKLPNLSKFIDIPIYGLIISISSIFTFLIISLNLFTFLNTLPVLISGSTWIGFFFIIILLSLIFLNSLSEMRFTQLKTIIQLCTWLMVKSVICILLTSILNYFIYQFFILNVITLFCLTFAFFTPLSLYVLKNLKYISVKNQLALKKVTVIVFMISLLSIYLEILFNLTPQIPIFSFNPSLHISTLIITPILIIFYFFSKFNKIVEEEANLRLFGFYILSIILSTSLLYFGLFFSPILIVIVAIFILTKRNIFPIYRFITYFLLSYVIIVDVLVVLTFYEVITAYNIDLIGLFAINYPLSLSGVLFFSILLNIKRNNTFEKFSLYFLISTLSFIYLSLFTNILLLYNITISLFLFLLFLGISFYRKEDERYKWFINPCVILFVFDFISFMSYFVLFSGPIFSEFNPILTFTLTLSMTGFAFVLLYNNAPARFRKKSFYIVLISIVISFPTFIYFLIIAALSMPLLSIVPLIVSINFGVFLFYLSIGIYQWKVSWAIWKSGWYMWNILPIINWYIIYQSLTGIDIFTTELWSIGTLEFGGSFFLSLIICSLFFIPVVYSKIKKYFSIIVFTIWGESLFLLYWFSQNLFVADLVLRNLFFIMFSATLLMPLLMLFKFWKIVSIFWLFPMTFMNVSFLLFYLTSIGLPLEITISLDILVIGIFLIVYSFFPNIRSIGLVLITAYSISLLGIFLTIYFILYAVIHHIIFAVNLSLLVFGVTLFSSKYLKLPKRIIDLCLSWILIINFSWLTFNTFYFFLGFIILALSLGLTVFGCSYFIFNRYKMRLRLNKIYPYLAVALGSSLSITSLSSILFHAPIGILITVFSAVFIIFLYKIFVEYRYILWFVIPIPIISPIIEWLLTLDLIYSNWIFAFLSWPMLYLITFQILINLFKRSVEDDTEEIKNSIFKIYKDKTQLKWLNFTCFLTNSVCISLFLTIILPNLFMPIIFTDIIIVYQIFDFLFIWPFLFLICMKYIIKSELDIKLKGLLRNFSILSCVLYLFITIAVGMNIFLYLVFINLNLVIIIYLVLLSSTIMLFIEVAFMDKSIFKFLIDSTRNRFTLWSWFIFCNTFSLFIYLFHLNPFLLVLTFSVLNLLTLHFMSRLKISKETISKLRILLIYNSFIWSSFFIASLISNGLVLIFDQLRGFGYLSLLFQNSSLFLYFFSLLFVRIEKNIKYRVEFILFIVFQGLIAVNLAYIFILFGSLNFISINLIIFIEICLSFVSIKYYDIIWGKQKYPDFSSKIHSFMVLILYFEISIMVYGLVSAFLGVYESILVALSILFVLTLLDIYSIKKVKIIYAGLVHTISYFALSLNLFLFLHSFVSQFLFLLSLEIFFFLIMQFYTNYSFFKVLKLSSPVKKEAYDKAQKYIHRLLGIGFYATLCFSIVQPLILVGLNLQLILLILSIIIHILMIIDSVLFKFLGKLTDYVKSFSWIMIMIFTSTYLIWIYSTLFSGFFFTVIPIIVIIQILEFAYLFKLLSFWKVVATYKKKIKSGLIIISYLNFITWPLYFLGSNHFANLNLFLASLSILFVITLIDKIVNEKLRKSLRSISFLVIGALLSVDLFLGFLGVPNFDLALNISSSLLIFVIFLTIQVRPFKKHSKFVSKAFIFWLVIFTLLCIIVYRASSLGLGITFIIFGIILYPFIFLLEELKRFINNIVEYLSKFFKAIQLAIKNMFIKIFHFIKVNYKTLWIIFSVFISSLIGISISPAVGNLLGWTHSILLIFPIFGMMYAILPSKKTDDVDVRFRRRIIRLIISWGSIIVLLFAIITPVWYVFTFWISIWIIGVILLPYIRFKERSENISIKWRFYTLIIFIVLVIVVGIIVGIQIFVNIVL